jgi:hypothetical protein
MARSASLLALLFTLALALPGVANATTISIGQVALPEEVGPGKQCGGSCGSFQAATAAGSPSYQVPPGSWVITKLRHRTGTGDDGHRQFYLVEDDGAGTDWTLLGITAFLPINPPPRLEAFDVSIPVSGGWRLGVRSEGNGTFVYPAATGNVALLYSNMTLGTSAPYTGTLTERLHNVAATLESDLDGDGEGDDSADTDDDGDGVADGSDTCPLDASPDQTDSDGDGAGNPCDADDDGDGVADAADNCSLAANAGQEDPDADGQGTPCDADDDNDGSLDAADNCPSVANVEQTDSDGDGAGDACDSTPNGPVSGPALACANLVVGTSGADVLTGTAAGDRLRGLGGRDRLTGGDGDDCLVGGRGRDRLGGGAGNDKLTGGSGRDALTGGPGLNAYDAGGGRDRVDARNGVKETVRCGKGRDRARLDADDVARRCERVSRP